MANTADPGASGPENLSYEAAREQLIEVVQRLEAGGTTLEESLALWEKGERLADAAQALLEGAKAKLDSADGVQP